MSTTTPKPQILISFKDYRVISINQTASFDSNKDITNSLQLIIETDELYSDIDTKYFGIIFKVSLKDKSEIFNLDIEILANFETDSDITEEFKNGPFVKINSRAIAFPYVRSVISIYSLNGGFNPINIPTVNWVTISKNKDSNK